MLDTYICGSAKRLSPEAPCPVIDSCEAPVCKLGGAANVAYQIAMSGFNVSLWGMVGDDQPGDTIRRLLRESNVGDHAFTVDGESTTVKTRYIAGNHQQLLRVDNDSTYIAKATDADAALRLLHSGDYSVLVISDYSKGAVTAEVATKLIALCNRLTITSIVDIKDSVKEKYAGASVIKGNKKEFNDLFAELGLDSLAPLERKLSAACTALGSRCMVMTCGEEGICAYSADDGFVRRDARSIPIHDVTGAGDVVTAFLAMLSDADLTFAQKVEYANAAANRKVLQVGTGAVLLDDILHNSKLSTPCRVKTITRGKRVVFTNGCFDVIHSGHTRLLNAAKQQGDVLVVGLNSDASVKRLKGNRRPVNNFDSRAEVLSSLSAVDFVIEFAEDTPLELIQELCPDVIVKGGDYSESQIVGAEFVKSLGGRVVIVPLVENQSSTNILSRLDHE